MAKWRYFAARELPKVIRDLRLPAAQPVRVTGMNRCPTHRQLLGRTSRICPSCHHAAWEEVASRYRAQEHPQPERNTTMSTNTDLVQLEPGETMPAPPPITLFGTTDPRLARERMADLAGVLVDVVKDRGLSVSVNGRDFLTAEAWTTLGGMLGVVPVVEWTRPNESGDGYLARVEARTLDGRVVGAAESECSRGEAKWKNRDAFQLRSMAQTRAIGRALRAPLGMIPVLAGYDPAAVEEVSGDAFEDEPEGKIPPAAKPSDDQIDKLRELIVRLAELDPETDWHARCREIAGVPGDMLTGGGAGILIGKLEAELARMDSVNEDGTTV